MNSRDHAPPLEPDARSLLAALGRTLSWRRCSTVDGDWRWVAALASGADPLLVQIEADPLTRVLPSLRLLMPLAGLPLSVDARRAALSDPPFAPRGWVCSDDFAFDRQHTVCGRPRPVIERWLTPRVLHALTRLLRGGESLTTSAVPGALSVCWRFGADPRCLWRVQYPQPLELVAFVSDARLLQRHLIGAYNGHVAALVASSGRRAAERWIAAQLETESRTRRRRAVDYRGFVIVP